MVETAKPPLAICILAGGRSRRMGYDKAGLRLGKQRFLTQIRAASRATGLPVTVLRRDRVPRCGPLGGVYTALKMTAVEAVLFLACDMPLITTAVIKRVIKEFGRDRTDLFVRFDDQVGFPFVIARRSLPVVEALLARQVRSVQSLAKTLDARILQAPASWRIPLTNANTPRELETVRRLWKAKSPVRDRRRSPRP